LKSLNVKSRLDGSTNLNLKYSVTVQSAEGPLEVADPKATRALVSLMDMQAGLGGAASHYGGPAALAELMSVVHAKVIAAAKSSNRPWNEVAHIVNDAGHCENGLYALKANYGMAGLSVDSLKGFRSSNSPLTGHGEAHLFPEGVLVSNGPLGSSIGPSQGLAMGDKINGKDRVTVAVISDGASMEGEARECFASIPGLASRGLLNPYILVISDNNTKLSGRINEDAYSMNPTFDSLSALGWETIQVEQGNDLNACMKAFESAWAKASQNPTKPVAIWAKTIKGIGVKATAESSSGGHGFPLKDPADLKAFLTEIYEGAAYPSEFDGWIEELVQIKNSKKSSTSSDVPNEKIQVGVAKALIECRAKGLPVVSVTSDLPGSTGVAGFRKEFPEASYDVGVAESNMVSVGAGLAASGMIPVVDTFAQFGTTKGALPLTMANLSQAPVICVYSHTGFQDAADGASHQALSYFAMSQAIADVEVISLSCSDEAYALVTQAVEDYAAKVERGETPKSTVFFLGRENFPRYYQDGETYKLGSQKVYKSSGGSSKRLTLAVNGSLMMEAFCAKAELEKEGIDTDIVHVSSLTSGEWNEVKSVVEANGGKLVLAEDHQKYAGMGATVIQALAERGVALSVKHLAVDGKFGRSAYSASELYEIYGVGSSAIVSAAKELLN
jgi:transketolase